MTKKKLRIRQQAFALTLCTGVFMVVYNFSTWYASSLDDVPSYPFDFEQTIPFIPISIIPYMASGFFFCFVFFSCKNSYQLKILTQRMLFVIITAGIFFITFPLRFSFDKPDVSNSFLDLLFSFLKTFDSPFNQSPSLHIAFAFIFWSVFRELQKWKLLILIWLILLGISTLTTYQHHLIDILSGAILAHLSFVIIPYRKNNFENVNITISNWLYIGAWLFISAALMLNEYSGSKGLLLFLPALLLFITGYNYQTNSCALPSFSLKLKQNLRLFKKNNISEE